MSQQSKARLEFDRPATYGNNLEYGRRLQEIKRSDSLGKLHKNKVGNIG
jgi:hypothetical protein